ncbi:MAG TPA: hypothetical protein VN634_06015 [Candidatus Limnocylindrales bacterium]|nr:hypothetical protein [Candidatus Limnocylindrales bacterium]
MRASSSLCLIAAGTLVLHLTAAAIAAAPPQFTCGDVVQPTGVAASDALATLQSAVFLRSCEPCACDADGSSVVTASDALLVLKKAVGQNVTVRCPFCCAECACTPQTLTLTLADLSPCEGCIPRVPVSNHDIDGITISFSTDFNDAYELDAVAECVWETVIPEAVIEKVYFGSGDPTCSGSSTSSEGGGVLVRVTRENGHWELRAGTYTFSLGWGDVASASVASASCEAGGSAANDNETCHLAGETDPNDYDTHVVGGDATVAISDPEPVCTQASP